ncbi:NF038104 family lipoprotein [Neisseria chenwenguii]|nr:NF038104 family lipoprotein [Neisseria chenwenguii]
MKSLNVLSAAVLCFSLSGCVVGAVADLAATTVVTAGKVVVKGTGAVVRAAIPDGDDEKEKKKKAKKEQQREPDAVYEPVSDETPAAY